MSENRAPMEPDQSITWDTYVLAIDDILRSAGVLVRSGDEIDVEPANRTAIRVTVKHITQKRR